MTRKLQTAGAALAVALAMTGAAAAEFLPALVSYGPKYDQSFNEMAYLGADRFKKTYATRYLEIQIAAEAQKEQALRAMVRRGANMVIALGFAFRPAVETVAREFPAVKFAIIDSEAKGANVSSTLFRQEEGSFLVGMAAALKSESGKVGFIGAMDVPLIRSFGCGYAQGVKHVAKGTTIVRNTIGNTPAAFYDPGRGGEIARSQFDRGVDVIFAAAGPSSVGMMEQAKAGGRFFIGVDSNQNHLYPGTMLTSMVKRADNAVFAVMKAGREGRWRPGLQTLGLKEGGVDWALDSHNRALVTAKVEKRLNAARDDIVAGRLKVVDYRTHNRCPVAGS
ncbi:BMP family lipoprotein [Paludibacterium yongneupense]|uniref:BMP family lipoprotein n=1 Tax=Paludibacterium yongneupense TaxID=400061 RepID=UPI0004181A6F|nr:BMP family ABC transporter substrate-binding protein [Paludibacterium yongneupense]